MPSEAAHLAIAARNQKVIDLLVPNLNDCAEWIATIAFYKALHLVEAVYANDPAIRHGQNHEARERHLKANKKYSHIWKYYRLLWAASTVARYLEDHATGHQFTSFSEYLSPADVQTKVLGHWLRQIEISCQKLLKK